MIHRRQQQGLTAWSLAAILVILGFFALLAIRLVPVYLEYFKVSTALESLTTEPGAPDMSEAEILDTLLKRLDIDDVHSVTAEDVLIDNEDGTRTVEVEYEVRTPILGNVDAVVYFDKVVELP